jgi:alanine racemase
VSQIRALIDLAALRHNVGMLRARAPQALIAAVVKANAYGHGLVAAARALPADAFAVARIEEGVALREAGITRRILLLEGVSDAAALLQARSPQLLFDLVVHEPGQLALLAAQGAAELTLWLKIDTGMNRLGFRPAEVPAVLERIGALNPRGLHVMTHLACADEAGSPMTAAQLRTFDEATAGLSHPRSIAASAALLGGLPAGDWVRPGLALYGVSPLPGRAAADFGLKAVMTLETCVIAVREVPRGQTVGYGATWRAARDSRIAIIAAGYADGLPRNLPGGTPVLIQGRRAGLAGRISMDMSAVDVSDLPPVPVGARAVLWGEGLPVEEIARHAGTIPYELLCAVSPRVPLVAR